LLRLNAKNVTLFSTKIQPVMIILVVELSIS
jgi:hypothetical protein